ncbi:MAG: M15 family metallopeptidase [bacterium]|nr:M15 family metallopeptidase [bacterium]
MTYPDTKEQITEGLPLERIKEINILETNEPLIEIVENNRIKLLSDHKYLSPNLRKKARDILYLAADNLPIGYKLLIVTAYRPIRMQKELYDARLKQLAMKHPLKMIFNYRGWRKIVNLYTSPPGGSSHQSGGALDVTVIDREGNRLDMGTELTDFGMKVHTENNLITDEQRKNRKILYDAMTKAGFINYPLEWWHYSYGDRMWAAYSRKRECFYGPVTE